jgi:hypothetical protein
VGSLVQCMANYERHPRGTAQEVDQANSFMLQSVCNEMDNDPSCVDKCFTILMDISVRGVPASAP